MAGGRRFLDMVTFDSVDLEELATSPNGSVTRNKGSLAFVPGVTGVPTIWGNEDGSTRWRAMSALRAQTVSLAKSGGDFTDPIEARDYIASIANTGNRVMLICSPGDYNLSETYVMPDYSAIQCPGGHELTRWFVDDPNDNVVQMGTDTEVFGLQTRDASGSGASGFYWPPGVSDAELHDCKYRDCDIGFLSETSGRGILVRQPHCSGGSCDVAYKVRAGGRMFVEGAVHTGNVVCNTFFEADGLGSVLRMSVVQFGGGNTTRVGTVSNNAEFEGQVFRIVNCAEGFFVEASGGQLSLGSTQLTGIPGTQISLADSANVFGFLNDVYFDDDKLIKGAAATLTGIYDSSSPGRTGPTIIGELWLGTDPAEQVPLATYTRETASSGWVSGGECSVGGGLDVDVAAGVGLVNTGTGVLQTEWSGTTITVPANAEFWIYVTSAGVVTTAGTKPAEETNVLLSQGYADGTDVRKLSCYRIGISNLIARRHEYLFENIGPLWVSGLSGSINGLGVDIDDGVFYRDDRRTPTVGGAPVTFTSWYFDGSDWVATAGLTAIDVTQYNDLAGPPYLVALNANWAKGALYVCKNGGATQYHYVYPQAAYGNQGDAEAAPAPTAPGFLTQASMIVYGPVYQGTSVALVSLVDERPTISATGPGTTAAPTSHGALSGLGNDDHTQYGLLAGNAARNNVTGTFDFSGGGLVLPGSAAPAQTTDGQPVWDTVAKLLTIGDGASRKTMVDTNSTQTLSGKTLSNPTLVTPTIADFSNATHDHSNAAGGGLIAQATEALRGGLEVATQIETNTGTDDQRAITPAKLAAASNVIHPNIAGEFASVTAKASPVAADLVLIEDSEDSNNKKRATIGSLGAASGGSRSHIIDTDTLDIISSLTPVTVSSMSYTPPAGTWNVQFEAEIEGNGNSTSSMQLYSDGTPIGTLRRRNFNNNTYGHGGVSTQVTTTGVEVISLRMSVDASSVDVRGRSMTFTEVSPI